MTGFSSVVMGNESLLVQCSETLLARGNTIAAVVTRNPDIAGWARSQALRVEAPGADLAARLGTGFDWLLSIANLSIIPGDVLALPARGAINFHDGPLPRHAGLNAPVWALLEGETQHGITWHLIENGVDEGDILVSRSFDISPRDTALTLNTKAFEAAIDSFPALLGQLESGTLKRTAQDLGARSYHARDDRPAGHGWLDVTRPAAELERMVRALDHGPYRNPLALPKLALGEALVMVGAARVEESHARPGTVLDVTDTALTVACAESALVLSDLRREDGTECAPNSLVSAGDCLEVPDLAQIDRDVAQVVAHEAAWRKRLAEVTPVTLAGLCHGEPALETRPLALPPGSAAAAVALWAARLAGTDSCDIAYATPDLADLAESGVIVPWMPLPIRCDGAFGNLADTIAAERRSLATLQGILRDLPLREPEIAPLVTPSVGLSDGAGPIPGCALTVELGQSPHLHIDTSAIGAEQADRLARRLEAIAQAASADTPLDALPQMDPAEQRDVLERWNQTQTDHNRTLTMHRAFEAQVARTPDATALVFEGQQVSYADLDTRANRAAHVLREMGVAPGRIAGLCCNRSVEMVVGALAILKAGGAYLPMDPSYPAERLQHFVKDSGAAVIVTQASVEPALPRHDADLLLLDAEPRLASASPVALPDTSGPEDLAYLIYTSGSTGTPKGVMVEHRNVLNFYRGMDDHIPHDVGDTWLAVTSLSFDISVLELFWTMARGLKVVLTSDEDRGLISNGPLPMSGGGMEFSIYYWGNDDGVGRDKYRLLLEGAQFADENGFVAVWTPERHFHAFGGPYPNPSVTGAAVAGMTRNIGVRGGSVVAPLHHPARIAEEWAVIDNLTGGRAGMAIASGWQPDDFVLRPENTPPANKPAMTESIHTLRKLWRGEAVGFPKKDGTLHEVVTQPRPVSSELPVWVTTAGNPATWQEAGALGCNVLTHLLGQSIEEVRDKIGLYHEALRGAGHDPANFTVTLMLHTFLSDTRDHAREIAREPMKDYLRSAAGLIKQYAWAFPAFKRPEGAKNAFDLQLDGLEDDELDAILDFAFERYFNDSGLFGTVEDAVQRAEDLRRIGVTEIACLIDYGIARETVLEGLKPLAQVVAQANVAGELAEDDFSIAAQILRHDVTHLQCTPSMARMIAMNDEARFALSRVQHLFLGGEPLPGALVEEFSTITQAGITNMYGPTETTIWSSVEAAEGAETVVNIGLPLANQQLYVLDADRAPVPVGAEGELWIGGEGVTRGYWNRPELTAERFADNPFHPGRMYRTGDLVRRRPDGRIDFVGRVDHQIKLRGFRIELGEIEAQLEALGDVTQAVVTAREDTPGDIRLVGYYTGSAVDEAAAKAQMSAHLPGFMVPGRLVHLDAFPLTPNKKVDRNALPAPQMAAPPKRQPKASNPPQPAAGGSDTAAVEASIARIWSETLGVRDLSARDNFFDLGGHSLLAVQAHRAIREALGTRTLSITDIFRFPVLGDLAARVATMVDGPSASGTAAPAPAKETAPDRANARSEAMARRREMRARRRA